MTRIDFAFGANDKLRTACLAVRKRYTAGERVLVFCTDKSRLLAFDKLLWAFDPVSFIPHADIENAVAFDTPVLLSQTAPRTWAQRFPAASMPGWMLNLSDECAPDVDMFARVMEIVGKDETDRQAARGRWKTYQSAGHALHGHDLTQTTAASGDAQ